MGRESQIGCKPAPNCIRGAIIQANVLLSRLEPILRTATPLRFTKGYKPMQLSQHVRFPGFLALLSVVGRLSSSHVTKNDTLHGSLAPHRYD